MSELLVNKASVRQHLTKVLQAKRPHLAEKKTRVSAEFYLRVDAKLRAFINQEVDGMSSVGSTIK